jgi:hypothetical protein
MDRVENTVSNSSSIVVEVCLLRCYIATAVVSFVSWSLPSNGSIRNNINIPKLNITLKFMCALYTGSAGYISSSHTISILFHALWDYFPFKKRAYESTVLHLCVPVDHAIAQAVSRQILTMLVLVQSQVKSWICGGQSGTGAGFL